MSHQERKEFKAKIDIFDNAFRKIKGAMGVSDVNEVIQKIVSQEGTHAGSAAAAATSLFLAVVVEFVDDCPRPLH